MTIVTDAQIYTGHLPNGNQALQRMIQIARERNKQGNKGKETQRTGPAMVHLVQTFCHKTRSCAFDFW